MNAPSAQTGGNTARVATYAGGGITFAGGLVYTINKRLELNMDDIETAFALGVVAWISTVGVAFIWNYLKDRGTLGDNRGK